MRAGLQKTTCNYGRAQIFARKTIDFRFPQDMYIKRKGLYNSNMTVLRAHGMRLQVCVWLTMFSFDPIHVAKLMACLRSHFSTRRACRVMQAGRLIT